MDGNYHNSTQNATEALQGEVSLTVLVSSSGPLTKRYRALSDGKVERVPGSLAMTAGEAKSTPIAATTPDGVLSKLKQAFAKLPPQCAVMTGLPPAGRKVWSIAPTGKEDVTAGTISRSKDYFSAAEGPALFALDFDLKEYPGHIRDRIEASGGLEAVFVSACPELRDAARLVAPSASSFIRNTATGFSTGGAGEHWYFVIPDGRETIRLAESIAERLEAAGWCWGHVTKSGTIKLKTLIDTAATNPARILYEAAPILEDGLAPATEKAALLVSGGVLRATEFQPLTDAEAGARLAIRAAAEAAVSAEAARVRLAWKQEREACLIERGVDPEKAARAVSAASGGELMGDFEIQFDDGTSASVREILMRANEEALDGKTCADPIEPEYGGGRNIAVLQLGYPPQVYSQAHGGMTYRLVLDPGDFFECATKSPEQEAIEAAAAEMYDALEAQAKAAGRQFLAWRTIDPASVPRIRFVYGDSYAAGYLTVTYAAPKTGKSLLALAEAIDACTGRGFLTGRPGVPQRVLYFNAEDDQAILEARTLAVLQHYGIPQSEIEGRFFAVSGVSQDRQVILIKGDKHEIQEETFGWLTDFIQRERITLAIFDPLQDLSQSPETNEAFRALGGRIRRLGHDSSAGIGVIHHTRKPSAGVQVTIDDGRGGSALRGVARFNRLLVPMTETEGAQAGVADHRRYFRIAEAESNLAPPSADRNRWFEKIGLHIGNGEAYPAVKPWTWPETFNGVTPSDAARVRALVAERDAAGNPARAHSAASDWAGKIVAQVLGLKLDGATKRATTARVSSMLKEWVEAEFLQIEHRAFGEKGKTAPFVVPGPKTPELSGDVFE
jgi:hypothetical protein